MNLAVCMIQSLSRLLLSAVVINSVLCLIEAVSGLLSESEDAQCGVDVELCLQRDELSDVVQDPLKRPLMSRGNSFVPISNGLAYGDTCGVAPFCSSEVAGP
jgi:hypothetical protein